jgi:hypothetical protein
MLEHTLLMTGIVGANSAPDSAEINQALSWIGRAEINQALSWIGRAEINQALSWIGRAGTNNSFPAGVIQRHDPSS